MLICWNLTLGDVSTTPQQAFGHVAAQARQCLAAFWPRSRVKEGARMSHIKKVVGPTQNSSLCHECVVCTSLADWQIFGRELGSVTRREQVWGGWGVACLSPLGRNHREWPMGDINQLQKLSISVGLAADEEGRGLRESQTACFGLFDCDVVTGLALKHGIKASVARFVLYPLVILEFLVPVAHTGETRVPELTLLDL